MIWGGIYDVMLGENALRKVDVGVAKQEDEGRGKNHLSLPID